MYLKTPVLLRLLLFCSILHFSGCQYLPDVSVPDIGFPDVSMPSLGFEEEKPKEPVIPISVAYAFDPSVTEATLEIQACDLPYTLKTGESILQTFLTTGQETFQSVTAYAGSGQAVQSTRPSDLIIQISMVNQSFEEVDRMAEEDNYLAFLTLQLRAVFIDKNGMELAQTPLHFNRQIRIWAPSLTGQSVSCTTGQYDGKINGAAAELAQQLVELVPELIKNGSPQPLTASQVRQPAFAPSTPRFAPQAPPPAAPGNRPFLIFRTMLKDGNDNLILEGGEAIVLTIEATNMGSATVTAVNANVVGNAALVEAFSRMTPLPISMGAFQPGETRTTEIRGRMPLNVPEQKAELVVALQLEDGSQIGSHRIVAPLQPGTPPPDVQARPSGARPQPPSRQPSPPSPGTQESRRAADTKAVPPVMNAERTPPATDTYVAMLIGMDAYQTTWPQAYHVPQDRLTVLQDTLQTTGLFTDRNVRVLQGSQAAKSDIEKVLLTWVRQRMNGESVLIVYFSGQALKDQANGEVYLVPYEGSPDASTKQLISLRTLQRVLGKLQNRLTLFILDAPIVPMGERNPHADAVSPVRWTSGLSQQDKTPVIQIRKLPGQGNGEPADVLAGLLGSADRNQNGTITIGEFLEDASESSEITLLLPDSSPLLAIPLAR